MNNRKSGRVVFVMSALLILFLSSLLILFTAQLVTLQSFSGAFVWIGSHLLPSIITIAALIVAEALFYGLSGKFFIAYLLTGLPVLLLSTVSYYKSVINGFPLLISDLSFSDNLSDIASFALPQIKMTVPTVFSLLSLPVATVLLFFADRKIHAAFFPKRAILSAVCGTLTVCFFLTGIFLTPAADAAWNFSQEERIDHLGISFAFYSAYAVSQQEKNEGYDELIAQIKSEVQAQNDDFSSDAQEHNKASDTSAAGSEKDSAGGRSHTDAEPSPTVILLMSESFFDISRLDGLDYPEDITPNFHRLAETCTSGLFYSNTYAGGTGNVEIEVMTGISRSALRESDTITALPDEVYSKMPTLAAVFREHGYKNIFLHSHTAELYNRSVIYKKFGFDEILFSDSFPKDAERRGGFISDRAFTDKIISIYEENKDEPIFLSAVSVENHQPYNDDKFAVKTDLGITSELLSEKSLNILQNYTIGLKDADTALGQLTDYFEKEDQPVIIIFFGDHLPNLGSGDGALAYSDLGYVSSPSSKDWKGQDMLSMLSTDYLIWTNYETDTVPDHNTSTSLLGLEILKKLGFSLSGYYQWMDENVAPYMLHRYSSLFVDGEDRVYDEVPDEQYEMIRRYSAVVYDIVYGNNVIFPIVHGNNEILSAS